MSVEVSNGFNQKSTIDLSFFKTDDTLPSEDIDVSWTEHLGQFIKQDNIMPAPVGVDQTIITKIVAMIQGPENSDKGSDSGSSGQKYARSFIFYSTEYILATDIT